MIKDSFYPVLLAKDVQGDSRFYEEKLGFKPTFTSDWYISLIDESNNELAILDYSHETIPAGYGTVSKGIILNVEVKDVDGLYAKFSEDNTVNILLDIKSENFGQRHFIIEAPNKNMIDIITNIKPNESFKNNYE